jgi:hypothetical protein
MIEGGDNNNNIEGEYSHVMLRVNGMVSAEYRTLSALVVVGAAVRLRDTRADSSTLKALVVVGMRRGNDEGDVETVRITLGFAVGVADLVGNDSEGVDDVDDVSGNNEYVVSAEFSTLNALVVVVGVVAGRCCGGSDDVSGTEDVMFSVLAGGNDDNVGSNAEYSTLKALVVVGDGNDEHGEE